MASGMPVRVENARDADDGQGVRECEQQHQESEGAIPQQATHIFQIDALVRMLLSKVDQ